MNCKSTTYCGYRSEGNCKSKRPCGEKIKADDPALKIYPSLFDEFEPLPVETYDDYDEDDVMYRVGLANGFPENWEDLPLTEIIYEGQGFRLNPNLG